MLDLDLIKTDDGGKTYAFNIEGKRKVAPEIFLYAIIKSKGDDMTIPYEALQNLGLIFCMNDMETITMLQNIADNFHDSLDYSDIAGIRQLQFKKEIYPKEVLDKYYGK